MSKVKIFSIKNGLFALSAAVLPSVSFAQVTGCDTPAGIQRLFCLVNGIINGIIPILIGLAVLLFLYGIVRYIMDGKNPEGRSDASKFMVWGIVAIFVMVSVWGLVGLLTTTIFGSGATPTVPTGISN